MGLPAQLVRGRAGRPHGCAPGVADGGLGGHAPVRQWPARVAAMPTPVGAGFGRPGRGSEQAFPASLARLLWCWR